MPVSLVLAVAVLFTAPALLWLTRRSTSLRAGLDGFVLVVVAGVSLIHLGPHAVLHGGVMALVGIAIGVLVPTVLHRAGREGWWVGSALLLLGLHAFVDGGALAVLDPNLTAGLGAAVVAHRLPVGLAIVTAARRQVYAALVLAGLAVLTIAGFAVGQSLEASPPPFMEVLTEGLVVGGLLHVVGAHRVDGHSAPHGRAHHAHCHSAAEPTSVRRASATGALLGVLGLAGLGWASGSSEELAHLHGSLRAFLSLTVTSAPALLTGFVLAGLVSAFLNPARAGWLSGGSTGSQALRGVAFGLPLPVCSCGVVPMYRSLIQRGTPIAAGLAFLVATPELGLDAVLLSVPLLGLPLTIARVVAALVVAVAVAWVVSRGAPPLGPLSDEAPAPDRDVATRLRTGLRYGLVELVDHTLPWMLAGLVLASLAEPLLDHELLAELPPAAQVPVAALVGVPLYVCASGATPLAALAVHKGLSAGAALAFLLAGPATNVTTFGILASLHGRRLAISFGVALTASAVVLGWGVDLLGVAVPEAVHPHRPHEHAGGWIGIIAAIGVAALSVASLWRQGARGMADQLLHPIHAHEH